ncbi:MAG TPA: GxxExxY protein [Chthoniobacterales bacterium]|nr:GxxExxY protein [Chthoniobacterales bacterium]
MNQEGRKTGKNLRNRDLTQRVIGAGVAVHRALGPGFLESFYEEALAVEFALSGIAFVRQKPISLFYKDHQIGGHRLDFLVENLLVVELKAIRALEDIHFAIGRSYLKATALQDGLLLNFATTPLTIKRFCRESPATSNNDEIIL